MAHVVKASEIKRVDKDGNPIKRHGYTVRYRDSAGKQREKTFKLRKDADDFATKTEHDKRAGIFVDGKLGQVSFMEYAEQVTRNRDVSDGTMKLYLGLLNGQVSEWVNGRTLVQVSQDRDGLTEFLNETIGSQSYNRRGIARDVVVYAVTEAVNSGKLSTHRLTGIKLTRSAQVIEDDDRASFVFPTHEQLTKLANGLNGYGLAVWLMRGCGLRIREALGVHREDFRDDGKTLRLVGQASLDGTKRVPLKHRRSGQYRDVPVPSYVWALVKDLPSGPVVHGHGSIYATYDSASKALSRERDKLGIDKGFTAHSLRHAFVSALLASGVPITSVARWLGHQTIDITYRVYGHLVPGADTDARAVLDAEWNTFKAA